LNPTKLVAGGSAGTALGVAVAYLGSRLGWHLTDVDGAMVVAAAWPVGAFLAHNGMVGVWQIFLHGERPKPFPGRPTPAEPTTIPPAA
jgi:hypothetical protein